MKPRMSTATIRKMASRGEDRNPHHPRCAGRRRCCPCELSSLAKSRDRFCRPCGQALGLFWAVELVKNRNTKKPLNSKADKVSGKPLTVDRIGAEMMKAGVAINPWISHFVIAPPLIIEKSEIDFGVSVLDSALSIADACVEE